MQDKERERQKVNNIKHATKRREITGNNNRKSEENRYHVSDKKNRKSLTKIDKILEENKWKEME